MKHVGDRREGGIILPKTRSGMWTVVCTQVCAIVLSKARTSLYPATEDHEYGKEMISDFPMVTQVVPGAIGQTDQLDEVLPALSVSNLIQTSN